MGADAFADLPRDVRHGGQMRRLPLEIAFPPARVAAACCRAIFLHALLLLVGAGAPAQAQKPGGTLLVAVAADPGHFNGAITTSGAVHAVASPLYNGLVALD